MNCVLFHDMLHDYLGDTLDEDRRSRVRHHLRECSECRAWAVARDPSLVFAAAAEPPVDASRVEACAASITAQIRQQRLRRRLPRHNRPWLAAVAAILIMVGGAVIWHLVPLSGRFPLMGQGGGSDAGAPSAPTVEVEMPSEGVRVYQFATEDDPDTTVVFIVNPALEL
jgi:predicted anti-sigma-YlaC factor YlaD